MPQQEQSPFEGVTEGTSLYELLRRAVKASPPAEAGVEMMGVGPAVRTARGTGGALDKLDTTLSALDLLLPMIPIAALYHGTSSVRLPSIMKAGLQARSGPGQMAFTGRPNPSKGVFVTPDLEAAQYFARERAAEDRWAIIQSVLKKMGMDPKTALASDVNALTQGKVGESVRPAILDIEEGAVVPDMPALGEFEQVTSRSIGPESISGVEILDAPEGTTATDLFLQLRELLKSITGGSQ